MADNRELPRQIIVTPTKSIGISIILTVSFWTAGDVLQHNMGSDHNADNIWCRGFGDARIRPHNNASHLCSMGSARCSFIQQKTS